MPKSPARVSFLLDRWESGVAGLSHHAEYIYFRCCQFLWAHGRAIKPNEVAAICRFHPDTAAGIEELIEAGKLSRAPDRSLANGRALEEHQRAIAISDSASKAAAVRWQSERISERNASPTPTPSPSTTPAPPPTSIPARAKVRASRAAKPNGAESNGHSEPSALAPSSLAWQAYDLAYQNRHGAPATRNAYTNTMIARFLGRVPMVEAPMILQHFVASNRARYVAAKHPLGMALQDAEALRTEWLTGRHGTERGARETDRLAETGAGWQAIKDELAATGTIKGVIHDKPSSD